MCDRIKDEKQQTTSRTQRAEPSLSKSHPTLMWSSISINKSGSRLNCKRRELVAFEDMFTSLRYSTSLFLNLNSCAYSWRREHRHMTVLSCIPLVLCTVYMKPNSREKDEVYKATIESTGYFMNIFVVLLFEAHSRKFNTWHRNQPPRTFGLQIETKQIFGVTQS